LRVHCKYRHFGLYIFLANAVSQYMAQPQKEHIMKNTIKLFGIIAIVAVIGFTMFACATASFGEVIKNAEALREYLQSQPANSPDAPLEITINNISSSMLKDVGDVLRSTDKYVSLKLTAFPLAINRIEDSTFRDCWSLTNLDLSSSAVYTIGNDAFRRCINLASITLPYDLSEFSQTAYTALADCPSLTTIEANYSKAYSSSEGVLYNKDKTQLIFYPRGKTGAFTVPGSVWEIAPYAFYGSKLTSITMYGGWYFDFQRGAMITFGIRNNAFTNCNNLTNVKINGQVLFEGNPFDSNLLEVYYATGEAIIGRDGKLIGFEEDSLGGTFIREIGSDTWSILSFPSGFMGAWKRDNYGNTLTFSVNSFTDSSQQANGALSRSFLARISDDSYTCYWASNVGREWTLTFRLENGDLVIEGDSGNDQRNWNGTWKKQ
jgi:hypothetical protein